MFGKKAQPPIKSLIAQGTLPGEIDIRTTCRLVMMQACRWH